jgi:trehalose 2-sulfotransferase
MGDPSTYHLARAAYDRDRGPGAGPPNRSYVICSTPRSGSSLLSEALTGSGVLGAPLEYFDRTSAHADLRRRWGCDGAACFVRCLHRYRTGPGDVLGLKLHWFQMAETAAELGDGVAGAPDHERERAALRRIAPGATLVYVHRLDRERQAISWALAEATGCWERRGTDGAPTVADLDPAAIAACRRRIDDSDLAWRSFFLSAGAPAVTVTYEQLAADYERAVRMVAAALGAGDATVPDPTLVRQSSAQTDQLLLRYRQAAPT